MKPFLVFLHTCGLYWESGVVIVFAEDAVAALKEGRKEIRRQGWRNISPLAARELEPGDVFTFFQDHFSESDIALMNEALERLRAETEYPHRHPALAG